MEVDKLEEEQEENTVNVEFQGISVSTVMSFILVQL